MHSLMLVPYDVVWIVIEADGITNETASIVSRSQISTENPKLQPPQQLNHHPPAELDPAPTAPINSDQYRKFLKNQLNLACAAVALSRASSLTPVDLGNLAENPSLVLKPSQLAQTRSLDKGAGNALPVPQNEVDTSPHGVSALPAAQRRTPSRERVSGRRLLSPASAASSSNSTALATAVGSESKTVRGHLLHTYSLTRVLRSEEVAGISSPLALPFPAHSCFTLFLPSKDAPLLLSDSTWVSTHENKRCRAL
ncbi:hypothetical protein ACFX13_007546 [Malus domestica]